MTRSDEDRSQILLRRTLDGGQVEALSEAFVDGRSGDGPEWRGLRLEIMRHYNWLIDDLMFEGHFVGLNLGSEEVQFDVKYQNEWRSERLPAGSFWIIPEGQPISVRNNHSWTFAADVVVDGAYFDSLLGRHYALAAAGVYTDALLAHLHRGLVEAVRDRDTSPKLIRELIDTFLMALATRHGCPAQDRSPGTTFSEPQLKALLSWIDESIGEALAVDQMAAKLGMSAAHFSRAFKRSMGITPWGHVVERRLVRAADLLQQGASVIDVADGCGFSDQAHLSRLFKRRFGSSPAAYARGQKLPADERSAPRHR